MTDLRARWDRYKKDLCVVPSIGLTLDVSCMGHDDAFLERMRAPMEKAFADMEALEKGAIANPDEKRQVGHYWLRDPDRAPDGAINRAIVTMVGRCISIAEGIHLGKIVAANGATFTDALIVGIGGSALGPQL